MKTRILLTILMTMLCCFVTCDEAGETNWSLEGTWSGLAVNDEGGELFTADFYQPIDTVAAADSIFGTIHAKEVMPFTGVIEGDHVQGLASGQCPSDVSLTVIRNGNEMTGSAVDRPGPDCGSNFVLLSMYRHRPAEYQITGTWTGSYSGTDGSGFLVLVLTQTGSVVTGQLFSDDTLAFSGHVYGDDFLAEIVESNPDCSPTVLHLRITTNGMTGQAIGGGSSSDECTFTASVTLTGTAALYRPSNRSPYEHH